MLYFVRAWVQANNEKRRTLGKNKSLFQKRLTDQCQGTLFVGNELKT
jgi:hypothetical protein